MVTKRKFEVKHNYTKIPNEIIYNNNLNPLALKLYIFLYGLKENYHPTYKDIIRLGGFTKYSLNVAIKELVEKSMIVKVNQPLEKIINGNKVFIKKNIYMFIEPEIWKERIYKIRKGYKSE